MEDRFNKDRERWGAWVRDEEHMGHKKKVKSNLPEEWEEDDADDPPDSPSASSLDTPRILLIFSAIVSMDEEVDIRAAASTSTSQAKRSVGWSLGEWMAKENHIKVVYLFAFPHHKLSETAAVHPPALARTAGKATTNASRV